MNTQSLFSAWLKRSVSNLLKSLNAPDKQKVQQKQLLRLRQLLINLHELSQLPQEGNNAQHRLAYKSMLKICNKLIRDCHKRQLLMFRVLRGRIHTTLNELEDKSCDKWLGASRKLNEQLVYIIDEVIHPYLLGEYRETDYFDYTLFWQCWMDCKETQFRLERAILRYEHKAVASCQSVNLQSKVLLKRIFQLHDAALIKDKRKLDSIANRLTALTELTGEQTKSKMMMLTEASEELETHMFKMFDANLLAIIGIEHQLKTASLSVFKTHTKQSS
ncbi:hypothetical protein CS022_07705 [Veronia nyctiphanis]|uniref:Uncharacterized protein n=1 Tax=Veronia nyctiphanis TaxID=1278244 RepID=A0A4Q0YR33_9GAMM|nr:hypothetical protein [Veronia nyctiphanis]RXJ73630.1 hypothetical protein CS022_07705 [Veronia nyctiphanis]